MSKHVELGVFTAGQVILCHATRPFAGFLIDSFLCRYGWDDQYYEYDDTGQYEGWVQDEYGEWHQEHHQLSILQGS